MSSCVLFNLILPWTNPGTRLLAISGSCSGAHAAGVPRAFLMALRSCFLRNERLVDGGNRQTFCPKRHKPGLGSCNRFIHIISLTLSDTTKEYHPSHGHSIMANKSTTLDQGLHSVHVSGTLPMKTVRFCAKTLAPWCHRKICGAWIRRIPHTIHTSHNYLDPWYQNSINSTSKIWIDRWPSWLGMVRHGSTRSLEASLSLSSASSSFRFLDLGAMDGPRWNFGALRWVQRCPEPK